MQPKLIDERRRVWATAAGRHGRANGVYERDRHPFLDDEIALLTERLASDRPVLGVCLGAQLMAFAAGSEVFAGKNGFEVLERLAHHFAGAAR